MHCLEPCVQSRTFVRSQQSRKPQAEWLLSILRETNPVCSFFKLLPMPRRIDAGAGLCSHVPVSRSPETSFQAVRGPLHLPNPQAVFFFFSAGELSPRSELSVRYWQGPEVAHAWLFQAEKCLLVSRGPYLMSCPSGVPAPFFLNLCLFGEGGGCDSPSNSASQRRRTILLLFYGNPPGI